MALNKIELDGKTYILVPEEVYNEYKPERARTGYERVEDGRYWAIGTNGKAAEIHDDGSWDKGIYDIGNYYTSKQLAADNARADSILRRMRQWQALNDVAVDVNSKLAKSREMLAVFRDDLIWLHTQYRRRLDEVRT